MSILSQVPNPPLSAVEVFYNGCKIVPAPLIDWTVESNFDDTGTRITNKNRLVLSGTTLISPSGSYEQMYTLQESLRTTFATDEKDFLILAGPGNKTLATGAVICSGLKPRITNVNITPDIHVTRFDWTVELEDLVSASGVSGVTSNLTNQWTFRENPDNCTLQVTHQVSAEGPEGESDKFEQALRAVKPLLGIDKLPIEIPCFVEPNASGLFGFTHPSNPIGGPIFEVSVQREETADVANGTYQVSEVFTIVSGVPFYFTERTESFAEDANGVATVTLAGSVQGLGRTTSFTNPTGGDGYDRACSGFVNVVRPALALDASGIYVKYKNLPNVSGLIVDNPTSYSTTQNRCRGTIDFSVTYTDDPAANLPSGISNLSSSINITEGVRVFASHAIPFRRLGPIIQDIKTTSEGTISIQCQAQSKNSLGPIDDTNRAITTVQGEINRLKDLHANPASFVDIRITNLNQQFSDQDLTCSASLDFAFTVDLGVVPDLNADISLRTL